MHQSETEEKTCDPCKARDKKRKPNSTIDQSELDAKHVRSGKRGKRSMPNLIGLADSRLSFWLVRLCCLSLSANYHHHQIDKPNETLNCFQK